MAFCDAMEGNSRRIYYSVGDSRYLQEVVGCWTF
jgi:hypothetical protein